MIAQYFQHFISDPILLLCSVVMLILFGIDLFGLLANKYKFAKATHRSFGGSIVSIGLFTTFVGILTGLYGFDTTNIAASVPQLLEGLRFAFAGSVLGMFLSLVLSITQKFIFEATADEEVLQSIDRNIAALVDGLNNPSEMTKQFVEMREFLEEHLRRIDKTLDKALMELAKGATEEVISALKQVITDFNNNLTEQFGDNFKELNAACLKLVEWQKKYRDHVDKVEGNLKIIMKSLDQSSKAATELTKSNKKTQEVCKEVAQLIATYDVQIKTLESHLQGCKELRDQANQFLSDTQEALTKSADNLNEFSGVIEKSVGRQSKSLARLTKGIEEQLPKALGELEGTLTTLTNQFADDYRSLFQFVTKQQ